MKKLIMNQKIAIQKNQFKMLKYKLLRYEREQKLYYLIMEAVKYITTMDIKIKK